jgi:hypothetical protein
VTTRAEAAQNFFYCYIGYVYISEYYFDVQHARLCASADFFPEERKLNTGQKKIWIPNNEGFTSQTCTSILLFSCLGVHKFPEVAFCSMCL